MHCRLCENLERALEARRSEYVESSSLAYYQVSKKFAAYKNVEMERARTELQEHRMVCLAAQNEPAPAAVRPRLSKPELQRTNPVQSAA